MSLHNNIIIHGVITNRVKTRLHRGMHVKNYKKKFRLQTCMYVYVSKMQQRGLELSPSVPHKAIQTGCSNECLQSG